MFVRKRKIIKKVAKTSEGFNIVIKSQVSNTTFLGVSQGTTKNFGGDIWVQREVVKGKGGKCTRKK